MTSHRAACACGQLQLTCEGAPVRVSACHCLDCQRRSGSVFAAQARFPQDRVGALEGHASSFARVADSGNTITFRFCPDCGSTVCYTLDSQPGLVAVPVGAFADPAFPAPAFSVYEERRHPWATVAGDAVEHID